MMCLFSLPAHWAGIRKLFPDNMIPKAHLGKKESEFRTFIEGKAGQTFGGRVAPVVRIYR